MKTLALALVLAMLGCSKTEEPSKTTTTNQGPATPANPTTGANAAAPSAGGELTWDAPSAWTTLPNPSAMRRATYKVPRAAGDSEDGELSVTQAGGGVDANIERWATQFGAAKDAMGAKKRTVNGLNVTTVETKGTFAGTRMPGAPPTTPKSNFKLLGAIVEGVEPPYFFKLTGPQKTVTAAQADFEKMVGTVRRK